MLVAGVRRVPPGNGMPQPLGGGSAMQWTAAATERDSSLYNEPSTPHQSPVTIGTVRGFQCFPPSPQNRVLAQPTPLHRPTSQLPPLAITTTPSLPSLPVQSLPSLLSLPLLPSLSSLSPRPSLLLRHCCPCASAISILDCVVATAPPPPPPPAASRSQFASSACSTKPCGRFQPRPNFEAGARYR
ncbi:hypothetical protein E4U09_000462 [Claviceps aff. purpurea]|uniref:Uncharacterized protein n=1 Tax=Claviceps aff. purpurea TaxID=1967640 RepID=A0A9P7QKX4_9HYPO|nr:hypothetical protein E4U09_000462 [Claviceps aff. purpurea]